MMELGVIVLASDDEQRTMLQLIVDGTGFARTRQSFSSFPTVATDPIIRRVQDLKPDIILVDINQDNPMPALLAIEVLQANCPKAGIFAIGDLKQPKTIVSAMRAGAKEYLEQPLSAPQFVDALTRFVSAQQRKNRRQGERGRIIVLVNAKGGSGATTIAVNTALSLAMQSTPTALVDFAPLGNAALHMNVKPSFGVLDALRNTDRLDGALLESFMTRHSSGLQLLAGLPEPAPVEAPAADLARLFDVVLTSFRFVVVDVSSRLDRLSRNVCELADSVLIVSHADVPSLWSAAQVSRYLSGGKDQGERVTLLLNRYRKISGLSDSDIEAATRLKIFYKVPNHYPTVATAIERGIPVAQQNHCDLARSYLALAKALTSQHGAPMRSSWLFGT